MYRASGASAASRAVCRARSTSTPVWADFHRRALTSMRRAGTLEHEVHPGRRAALHRVPVATEGLLEQRRERRPAHRAHRHARLPRCGPPRAARAVATLPSRRSRPKGQARQRPGDAELLGQQRRPDHAEHRAQHDADPPRRAQQDREERVLGHLELQSGLRSADAPASDAPCRLKAGPVPGGGGQRSRSSRCASRKAVDRRPLARQRA